MAWCQMENKQSKHLAIKTNDDYVALVAKKSLMHNYQQSEWWIYTYRFFLFRAVWNYKPVSQYQNQMILQLSPHGS